MRSSVIAGSLALCSLAASFAYGALHGGVLPARLDSKVLVAQPDSELAAPNLNARPAATPELAARFAEIQHDQVATIADEQQLDRYLAGLEQQARKQGSVSALEVQPGVEAIRLLSMRTRNPTLMKRVEAFALHMAQVSSELDDRDDQEPAAKPDFEALEAQIEQAPPEQRAAIIERYALTLRSASPAEQLTLGPRLNQLHANGAGQGEGSPH